MSRFIARDAVGVMACKDWRDFHRRFLFPYIQRSRERRANLLFRGQADADWSLGPTLDRDQAFDDDIRRAGYYQTLLEDFRRETFALVPNPVLLPEGTGFELLARHHGVPSQMVDWTQSPYIAAFFAFADEPATPPAEAALWVFDTTRFIFEESGVDFINDVDLIRFNPRALRQRGLFLRVRTIRRSLVDMLGNALTKITIPWTSRAEALAHLDEMLINSTSMYADPDGAARTVRSRFAPTKEA